MTDNKDKKNSFIDDLDLDSLGLDFNDSIGNQLETSFESSPYKNMNQKTYEGKQNVLMDYLRFYNEDLCTTINNKFAFMPLEQSMSMSVFDEGLKSLIHNKNRTSKEIQDLTQKFMEFLRNKDDRYSLFSRTLLEAEETNLHYDKNLYELDQKYFGLGISRKKFSVMQPFQIIELLYGKNLKKHHLSEMFDELKCDRISQHYPSTKPDTPKS
ncbi:hypothetical protein [Pseudomonas lundensis]|uniref:hypothetical protein n=1 Tax=Pseudomonas lundensis TaxID=86185 RepID=UPI000BA22C26|nr:hypothetical protein [Pseudomonas lundensis]OZY30530.1 hypothetical protein CJF36_21815 [Pseudomonas lundensis]